MIGDPARLRKIGRQVKTFALRGDVRKDEIWRLYVSQFDSDTTATLFADIAILAQANRRDRFAAQMLDRLLDGDVDHVILVAMQGLGNDPDAPQDERDLARAVADYLAWHGTTKAHTDADNQTDDIPF